MEFSAEMIASFLEGEIVGDKNAAVRSVAKIEEAKEGDLAFLANPKYEHYIYGTGATIVIVSKDFSPASEVAATMIKVADPYGSFARLLDLYVASKPQKSGVSPLAAISDKATVADDVYVGEFAVIDQGAVVGKGCKIYPQAYVGVGVKLGDNVIINSGVKIYEGCVVGDNSIIHSGAVIGADGFGFAPVDGVYKKIPQIGNVVIESDVEIGANTCIDRATMGSTVIKRGVKLDNLIQIGHNVVIGSDTVAAAQVGIAGSTKIGSGCMFGGQVGIAGHITVADRTQVASQSGIGSAVKNEGEVIMGSPAFAARDYQRSAMVFKELPQMRREIAALRKEIEQLRK
ncbi:MAG: UDP-3-O-(3-hydroxymyristoyl)glucosamine N-acyltransferase [Rikenellaceae bacterium]|nr:UDP-3-O-(3-hydroxymyristoyl)glucosamine N-acyltransferase [Rikenellaceae bacterium]